MHSGCANDTFAEAGFETSGKCLHIAHAAGPSGLSADALFAPIVFPDLWGWESTLGTSLFLDMV